jgi:aminoglycoside phosphotransferase (APT) family kinase protein
MRDNLDDLVPPVAMEVLAGGNSNLTVRLVDSKGRRWVLRRPPIGSTGPPAHDVRREYSVLKALKSCPVPLPSVFGLCTDEGVTGAPFYVMDFVEGDVIRDATAFAAKLGPRGQHHCADSLVRVLTALHAVDPNMTDLGGTGARDKYIPRQLHRLAVDVGRAAELTGSSVEGITEMHQILVSAIPPQDVETIVHGDFRLANCVLDSSGEIVAVLDWELCTIGDPLSDAALLAIYWDEQTRRARPTSTSASLPSGVELVARYADATGRDVSSISYYVGFGYWKLACMAVGIQARLCVAGSAREAEQFASRATKLLNAAQRILGVT